MDEDTTCFSLCPARHLHMYSHLAFCSWLIIGQVSEGNSRHADRHVNAGHLTHFIATLPFYCTFTMSCMRSVNTKFWYQVPLPRESLPSHADTAISTLEIRCSHGFLKILLRIASLAAGHPLVTPSERQTRSRRI